MIGGEARENAMRCPGQDRRNWTPDDVNEVDCARCGAVVEFFKTDGARDCPGCGARVVNPKVAAGCAQWCAAAKQCLGFDPKAVRKGSQGRSLAADLVDAVQSEFPECDHAAASAAADAVLQGALESGAEPRVALAAVVLDAALRNSNGESLEEKALATLESVGFDEETVGRVRKVLAEIRSGGDEDSPEAALVRQARR